MMSLSSLDHTETRQTCWFMLFCPFLWNDNISWATAWRWVMESI